MECSPTLKKENLKLKKDAVKLETLFNAIVSIPFWKANYLSMVLRHIYQILFIPGNGAITTSCLLVGVSATGSLLQQYTKRIQRLTSVRTIVPGM